MGVWIETLLRDNDRYLVSVTPFVGVWIETNLQQSWCGTNYVTPFVGVWIETSDTLSDSQCSKGHTLRGCVD